MGRTVIVSERSRCDLLAVIALLVTTAACSGVDQQGDQEIEAFDAASGSIGAAAVEVEVDEVLKATRPDYVSTITVHNGHWGDWNAMRLCAPGTYAVGVNGWFRWQYNVSDDDTSIEQWGINCKGWDGSISGASSSGYPVDHHRPINLSYSTRACVDNETQPNNPIWAFRAQVEAPLGGSSGADDTALNTVQFECTYGTEQHSMGSNGWGSWGAWKSCPYGARVCGMSFRTEGSQGAGDDTAANGFKMACCNW